MRSTLGFVYAIALAGCGGGLSDQTPDMAPPADMALPPMGDPITSPMNQWTWIDFPDSSCDDGSPTGIGVYNAGSPNLLVFMNGGGACWSYLTCYTLNTAVHGPFGQAQFNMALASVGPGTIFDRNEPRNPFRDWSYVFVPYCTGDVHAGDNVVVYTDTQSGDMKTYHHKGHANVLAYLKRIAPTFPSPKKLVVSGSSAGGYGASMNYADFRRYFPSSEAYLLDDSGPALEAPSIPQGYIDAWYASWNLGEVLGPACGDACKTDLSAALTALDKAYPHDRMALLSSEQDATIRNYFLLSPSGFQTALLMTAQDILDPTAKTVDELKKLNLPAGVDITIKI